MSKEAIEALESARAHILDAYRIWQADDVSAVPPPKSGAGAVIAKIDAVLSSPGKDGGQEVEAVAWRYKIKGEYGWSDWCLVKEVAFLEEYKRDKPSNIVIEPLFVSPQPASTLAEAARSFADLFLGDNGSPFLHLDVDHNDLAERYDTLSKVLASQPASTALVERLTKALEMLRDTARDCVKEKDGPHRVLFRDGFVIEGRVADEWLKFMGLIVRVADAALSASTSREGESRG